MDQHIMKLQPVQRRSKRIADQPVALTPTLPLRVPGNGSSGPVGGSDGTQKKRSLAPDNDQLLVELGAGSRSGEPAKGYK